MDNNNKDPRSQLAGLLEERGVLSTDAIIGALCDEEIGPALAAVRRWDERGDDSATGLLVHMVRTGAGAGYVKPSERKQVQGGGAGISDSVRKAVYGSCASPNGCTREEARDQFRLKAESGLGIPVDSLIDAVMGADWQETAAEPEYMLERSDQFLAERRKVRDSAKVRR